LVYALIPMNPRPYSTAAVVFLSSVLVAQLNAADAVSLFDGKSLAGWEGDTKTWRIEDGAITAGSLTTRVPRNDFLTSKKSFQNFELRLKVRLQGTDGFINSGVQFRSVRIPDNHEMFGYQCDAGAGWWGKLYDESRRKKVIAEPRDAAAATAAVKTNDWNELRIRTEGTRIRSWLNGVPTFDYEETEPRIPQDGLIGLQVHGGGAVLVQFKDIVIEELAPTPGAPTWDQVGRPSAPPPPTPKAAPAPAAK
jgi:hypothetical protein